MTTVAGQPKPSIATIWRNGITAAVVAAVINVILYFIGAALGGFPQNVITPMGQPITAVPVIMMSVITILAGTLGYTILSRITANPNRWFVIATAIIFILMIFTPFSLQSAGAPMLMVILLEIMHVVAAGIAVWVLGKYAVEK